MQPNPTHIGQYKILKLLGKGGMGNVWLGEHVLLARKAAIKTLLPNLSAQPQIVERFFNEAKATAAISDPGVVQIFDFGYHVDGSAYIVMELLEGEALCDRMDRIGPLPLVHALRIVRQVAGALASAHAVGIVHRDIKPENIFMIPDADMPGGERAKLLDFGICKYTGLSSSATETGTMLGTPVYMSPEQCRGSKDIDARSDVYALGCVLFHMLTDRTPFVAGGSGEYIVAHLNDTPPPPSTRVSGMSPDIDALVLTCMEKDPAARYQSMPELQEAIDAVLGGIDTSVVVEPAPRAMKLATGFRSAFDANIEAYTPSGTRATPRERPAHDLVITRTPITLPASNRHAWKMIGRAIAVMAIIGLALFGVVYGRDLLDDDDDDGTVALATTKPVAEPVVPDEGDALRVVAHDGMTAGAAGSIAAIEDATRTAVATVDRADLPADDPKVEPPVKTIKPRAARAIEPKRAATVRRHAQPVETTEPETTPPPAPSVQPDDLYDTR